MVEPDALIRVLFVPEASLNVSGHIGHEFVWAVAGWRLNQMAMVRMG